MSDIITIPNTFQTATSNIPLANLDQNFTTVSTTINGINDGTVTLQNPTLGTVGASTLNVTNSVTAGGSIVANGSGKIGYTTGAGGAVTQLTSKTTGVTLNEATGKITMFSSTSIGANSSVTFTLTNSVIEANDLMVLNHTSGGTSGAYTLNAQCAAGSANITVRNVTAGALAQAVVIGFAVIKSVVA